MVNTAHYIDGKWQAGKGEIFSSSNPANNKFIWQGHHATKAEVVSALQAAREAFPQWAALTVNERYKYLKSFAEIVKAQRDELAECISEEHGKPLWEAHTEVGAVINKVKISKQAFEERSGEVMHDISGGVSITRHKPHGVIAVFGPYNFPAHLPNGHIVPALLVGNTVVLKPSSVTPKVAALMIQYWHEAGLPHGVLNMIQGNRQSGSYLAEHPDIDGLFFTGSYAAGKHFHKLFAGQPEKILALEMGGNNPLIVSNVKDINAAVYHTIQSAFITSGQRCTCARRLIVSQCEQGDKFLQKLVEATKQIKVGAYTEYPEPFMGPLIHAKAARQILEAQGKLQNQGGKSLLEVKALQDDSAFVSPGIINVTNIKNRTDEEYFGPLLQVIRVKDFDAAIAEANNTAYGLSAGLFSDDKKLFEMFYQQSHAGIVNWNWQLTGAASSAPFGGVGHSGNHRPSAYYATDYCSYPVAGIQSKKLSMPEKLTPGITLP